MAAGFLQRLTLTLDMIKFEHSVFALPFALTGALLALREDGFATQDPWWKLLWIVVALTFSLAALIVYIPWVRRTDYSRR